MLTSEHQRLQSSHISLLFFLPVRRRRSVPKCGLIKVASVVAATVSPLLMETSERRGMRGHQQECKLWPPCGKRIPREGFCYRA
jgi:hypothetical protein